MKNNPIQNQLINNNKIKITPLILDEYDFSSIIKGMTFWEQLVRRFYTFLKKKELKTFYFSCGLKQITKDLEKHPNYYNPVTKELGVGFAKKLFQLIQALKVIKPIFEETILNIDIKKIVIRNEPHILEKIFHILYTNQDFSIYPFTIEQISKNISDNALSLLKEQIHQKIENYLHNIPLLRFEEIDDKYTDLIYFSKIFDSPLLNLVRRFNFDIDLDIDDPNPKSWSSVTIKALTYYLEEIYLIISAIHILDEDINLILLLNQNYTNDENKIISSEEIQESWKIIISIITEFQDNDCLLKLLCLSTENPCLKIENIKHSFTIQEQFKKILFTRVIGTTNNLVQEIITNNMKDIVDDILPDRLESLQGIGIYTVEYSNRMKEITGGQFIYIYIIMMIQQFMNRYFNTWLKGFLSLIAINIQFVNSYDGEKLEKLYKLLNRFASKFDKFQNDIKINSPISIRLLRLFNTQKISNGDKQLVIMFSDSINKQVGNLVIEFTNIFDILEEFISKLIIELEDSSEEYILNLGFVKSILGTQALTRVNNLNMFCISMKELIALSKDNIIHNNNEEINE